MMNQKEIKEYLESELKDEYSKMVSFEESYKKETDKFERFSIAIKLQKQEDKYYYLFMLCNDMGITAN